MTQFATPEDLQKNAEGIKQRLMPVFRKADPNTTTHVTISELATLAGIDIYALQANQGPEEETAELAEARQRIQKAKERQAIAEAERAEREAERAEREAAEARAGAQRDPVTREPSFANATSPLTEPTGEPEA